VTKFYGLTVEERAAIEELFLGPDPMQPEAEVQERKQQLNAIIAGIEPSVSVYKYRQDLRRFWDISWTHMTIYCHEGRLGISQPCFLLKAEHEFPGREFFFAGVISRRLGCGMLLHPANLSSKQMEDLIERVHEALRSSGDMETPPEEAIQARRFDLKRYNGAKVELDAQLQEPVVTGGMTVRSVNVG